MIYAVKTKLPLRPPIVPEPVALWPGDTVDLPEDIGSEMIARDWLKLTECKALLRRPRGLYGTPIADVSTYTDYGNDPNMEGGFSSHGEFIVNIVNAPLTQLYLIGSTDVSFGGSFPLTCSGAPMEIFSNGPGEILVKIRPHYIPTFKYNMLMPDTTFYVDDGEPEIEEDES